MFSLGLLVIAGIVVLLVIAGVVLAYLLRRD